MFYSSDIQDNQLILKDDELRHLNVLRKNIGDEIAVTDGKGFLYQCQLVSFNKKEAVLNIISKQQNNEINQTPYVHLLIAPTKQMDRIEWMFEKLVEMGLNELSFIQTQHTERIKINYHRLEKIAISAIKQSLQFQLPIVNPIINFESCFSNIKEGVKLIGFCSDFQKVTLKEIQLQNNSKVYIFIGPEGDFSENEIKLALNQGCLALDLGQNRLRTETAGLKSVTAFKI